MAPRTDWAGVRTPAYDQGGMHQMPRRSSSRLEIVKAGQKCTIANDQGGAQQGSRQ